MTWIMCETCSKNTSFINSVYLHIWWHSSWGWYNDWGTLLIIFAHLEQENASWYVILCIIYIVWTNHQMFQNTLYPLPIYLSFGLYCKMLFIINDIKWWTYNLVQHISSRNFFEKDRCFENTWIAILIYINTE